MKYEKSLLEEALYHWNSTENEEKRLRKWIQSLEEQSEKSKAYDEIMRIHRETEGEDFMVSISVLRRKIEEIVNSNPDIDESRL